MNLKSLKIKNESYYFWNDQIYLNEFDEKFVKVVKRESRIGADICYVSYDTIKPKYEINSVNSLYLIVKNLVGKVEQINGSRDRYLVVDDSNRMVLDIFDKLFKCIGNKIDVVNKDDDFFGIKVEGKINEYNKWRFSSYVELPVRKLIEFHLLSVVVSCVIGKSGKFYPEIYVDEGIYEVEKV